MENTILQHLYINFFGDHVSWVYFLEITLRTLFMFVYMILNVHFLYRKDVTEFNSTELIILLAFGSAVGDAMLYRNVPLFFAMITITGATLFAKFMSYLTEKSERIETFVEGHSIPIIEKGIILEKEFEQVRITKKRLFSILRLKGIKNTNEIEYAFAEGNGQISVIKAEKPHEKGESTLQLP